MRDRRTPIQPQAMARPEDPAITRAVLETLAGLIHQAALHTPGGRLMPVDMSGLYRRTASIHGLHPRAVQRLHDAAPRKPA